MNYLPFLIFIVVIVGLLAFSARARRRQASAEAERAERITVGTDVMTTSGLHGTVVAKNDDDTVSLSIAPGVEVRWELAALRDVASLPQRYRRAPESELDPDGTGSIESPETEAGAVDLGKSEPRGTDPSR